MVYNVVLICANGASTSILVEKMLDAAKKRGIEIVINAYSLVKLASVIDDADIILIAPQIRYKKDALEKEFGSKGVPFIDVNPMDYGMLDGEKILDVVLGKLGK